MKHPTQIITYGRNYDEYKQSQYVDHGLFRCKINMQENAKAQRVFNFSFKLLEDVSFFNFANFLSVCFSYPSNCFKSNFTPSPAPFSLPTCSWSFVPSLALFKTFLQTIYHDPIAPKIYYHLQHFYYVIFLYRYRSVTIQSHIFRRNIPWTAISL